MSVQYGIRAVRVGQLAVALSYLFGEQAAASLRRAPPAFVTQMGENPLIAVGSIFGLDVMAQTMHSINAFEVTYNGQWPSTRRRKKTRSHSPLASLSVFGLVSLAGQKIHSKLGSGRLPSPQELVTKLQALRANEAAAAEAAAAPRVRIAA